MRSVAVNVVVTMTQSVPRILVDADAIVAAGFGTSGAFRHLLREAADRRVELIVPEAAVAEAMFVLRRRLQHHRKALRELPSLLHATGSTVELNPEVLVGLAEGRFRRDLAGAGVAPVSAPRVDLNDLVRRILERRKPTKALEHDDKGNEKPDQREGFRDQLLWAHVRAAAEDGALIFVSNNTRDFADRDTVADGRAELHEDLVADLEADRREGGSHGDVTLVLDIETLAQDFLQDEDLLADVEKLLDGDAGSELRRVIDQHVNERGVVMDEFVPEDRGCPIFCV